MAARCSRPRHAAMAWLLMALTAAGCASLDPSNDIAEVRQGLAARLGADVPAVPADDLDATTVDEVTTLLQGELTEATAVRIALLHNRDVRAAYERIGVGRAELVQAGLLRNPVFDADARFLFDGGTELEFGLAQPFLDLFYRPLREKLAEHQFAVVRAQVAHDLVHLAFQVRRSFVRVRAAQQLVLLQQQALATAEASHTLMVELHAAGNATDQALAAERLGESRARLDLATAEQAAREAREPLHTLLGLWGADTAWTITGPLADDATASGDLAQVEAGAIAASLELQQNRAELDALAQQAGLASWQAWFPDATAGLSAIREPGGEWGLGPKLSLELPLLDDGSARNSKVAAQLRAGLHHHVQLAVEVRSAARLLRERTIRLGDRVRFLREVHLPQRAELLRTTLQHYNAMQIGVFDVLRQQQQQLADGREHLTTLRAAHLARLDLMELLAGSMPRSALEPFWPTLAGPGSAPGSGGH